MGELDDPSLIVRVGGDLWSLLLAFLQVGVGFLQAAQKNEKIPLGGC
ncbi:MAG TPA: hypothetical protein VIV12_07635 [Streptosporangiaceae bacterium]